MVVDLGTGDGRYVLATAAARPADLVIGIDANAASMAEAAGRAARRTRRRGLANALFVVSAAEAPPPELTGVADALSVQFPWGSLLRGLLTAEPAILTGINRITRPGAPVQLLISLTERDNVIGLGKVDGRRFERLAADYAAYGLTLVDARPATRDQIVGSHSTWAKRLRAGTSREVWLVLLRRGTTTGS